jgi:hypothetical protein
MSENGGASTSRNPKGLHGLYRDNFTLLIYTQIYAFLKYWRRNESTMRQYISYDSVRREVLYNVLIEFGVPMN